MPQSNLHPRDSQFHGWASTEIDKGQPLQLKSECGKALLALPHFANVGIADLIRMATEKLTYTKKSGSRQGTVLKGINVNTRAFAIAVLVGCRKLDDPTLQVPMEGFNERVMPVFASSMQ